LGGANLALYVGAASIKRKRRLLDGICPEALRAAEGQAHYYQGLPLEVAELMFAMNK
jgi:hypothetical protein